MPDFNPFDMELDGDVDGIDFLGFDYLARHVLQPDEGEPEGDKRSTSSTEDEAHGQWEHGD
jgi:hypothetical protein